MRTPLCIVLSVIATTTASARPLINIDFESAPVGSLPPSFYSALGLSIALTNGHMGPAGDGAVSIMSTPGGLPSPAAGRGIVPYANLAGFMGPFDLNFSTPIDYFSLWAFDGPQAFSATAYRLGSPVSVLNVPAQPGRLSYEIKFGSIGGAASFDRILVVPVFGIGGSDPDRGPKYYDALSFNTIPAPATASFSLLLFGFQRRRRANQPQASAA